MYIQTNLITGENPSVDCNMKAGIVPHEDINSRNHGIKAKTTLVRYSVQPDPPQKSPRLTGSRSLPLCLLRALLLWYRVPVHHQGRNPSSFGFLLGDFFGGSSWTEYLTRCFFIINHWGLDGLFHGRCLSLTGLAKPHADNGMDR